MIFQWFFWGFFRLGILISLLLTFLFLIFQIVRFDQILFQLPVRDLFPFFSLWFLYYFSYMLPTALFLSFSFSLFELKESKKLHIMESFGLRAVNVYTKSLFMLFPVLLSLSYVFYTLKEEDISFVRRQLMLKYYALVITSIPPKSFQSFGRLTLYVEKKEGNMLEGIFFKFDEGVVIAKKAKVEDERIIFEAGSLLTQREGKTFSTDFKIYRLNLNAVIQEGSKASSRDYLAGILNTLSPPFLMGIAYRLALRVEHHQNFYYLVGLASIVYQALLLLLKQRL